MKRFCICLWLFVAFAVAGCSRSSSPVPANIQPVDDTDSAAAITEPSSPADSEPNNPFADSQRIVIEDAPPPKSGVEVPALTPDRAEPRPTIEEVAGSVGRAIRRGVGADEPGENQERTLAETIGRALGKGLWEGLTQGGEKQE